jgi:hypothetical protein
MPGIVCVSIPVIPQKCGSSGRLSAPYLLSSLNDTNPCVSSSSSSSQDERARFSGGRVSKHDARTAASAEGICVVCARFWQRSPPGQRPSRAQRWQSVGVKLAWVMRSFLVVLRPIARWSMEGFSLLCRFFQSLSAARSLGLSAGLSMGSMRGR